MNIHEYQAKALLHKFGVPISRGVPVLRAADSDVAAKTLGGPVWVVKSQIHAGGRGKGKFKEASAGDKGGVRIAKSVAEANEFARQMLGATLVTVQTGPHGKQVNRLYVEEGSDIDKEFSLSIPPPASWAIMAAPSPRLWASRAISPSRRNGWWRSSTQPSSPRTWRCW